MRKPQWGALAAVGGIATNEGALAAVLHGGINGEISGVAFWGSSHWGAPGAGSAGEALMGTFWGPGRARAGPPAHVAPGTPGHEPRHSPAPGSPPGGSRGGGGGAAAPGRPEGPTGSAAPSPSPAAPRRPPARLPGSGNRARLRGAGVEQRKKEAAAATGKGKCACALARDSGRGKTRPLPVGELSIVRLRPVRPPLLRTPPTSSGHPVKPRPSCKFHI